jgi:acyl carrier protein
MREDLKRIFLDVFGIESISEHDSVETIEMWDSVRHVTLIMAIEERFAITFDAEEIGDLVSVHAVAAALARHQGMVAG